MRFGLLLAACAMASAATHPEAGRVLILVNDAAPPESGTNGKSASVFVGEYYAQQRGIPLTNILHLNIPLACCPTNVTDWDNWNMDWPKFVSTIRQPVLQYLADRKLTDQIDYLVPTYGVPVRTWDAAHFVQGYSIDSLLAGINSGSMTQFVANPYYSSVWNEGRVRFHNFVNPAGWKMYLVSRLDGPSLAVSIGLVDKAIRAEANLKTSDGIAYFDYRHTPAGDPYYSADQTVVNANKLASALGYQTVFNDNQNDYTKMIHNAPKALWAWGWYSGTLTWEGYSFVEGAVGAQLTSYTADSIRSMLPGTWVPLWLNAGITATWGATTEPYTAGYANGDNLFHKFWAGYNFGESAYLASPYLNHAMTFVGDPLYAPRVFQPGAVALKPPAIVSAADAGTTLAPGSIATLVGAGLSLCTASNRAAALPVNLCGTSVTMNGVRAPLFYVSPNQINVLVPRALPPGQDVRIEIAREDGQAGRDTLTAAKFAAVAPGIFAVQGRAIVQNAKGVQTAIKPGEVGVLYAAGLGATDAIVADTAASPLTSLVRALAEVKVWINGTPQDTFFTGFTPGQFGLYQVNFTLHPETRVADGDENFVWLQAGDVESAHVRIALAR